MKEAAFPVIDQDFFRVALDEKDGEWPSAPDVTSAFALSVAVTRERGIFLAMLSPLDLLVVADTDITEMNSMRHHPELHARMALFGLFCFCPDHTVAFAPAGGLHSAGGSQVGWVSSCCFQYNPPLLSCCRGFFFF